MSQVLLDVPQDRCITLPGLENPLAQTGAPPVRTGVPAAINGVTLPPSPGQVTLRSVRLERFPTAVLLFFVLMMYV